MENILEKGNKIDILNISSKIHAQGVHSFQEIYYAQIEPDGQLTVICDPTNMPSVIVMKDGIARINELKSVEKDEDWLAQQMAKRGIEHPESVFLAEFWQGEVKFILQDGKIK